MVEFSDAELMIILKDCKGSLETCYIGTHEFDNVFLVSPPSVYEMKPEEVQLRQTILGRIIQHLFEKLPET